MRGTIMTVDLAQERLRDLEAMQRREKAISHPDPEKINMIAQQMELLRSWILKAVTAR